MYKTSFDSEKKLPELSDKSYALSNVLYITLISNRKW